MIWNHAFDPRCRNPEACRARGAGACRSCSLTATNARQHADPAFRAARDARGRAHFLRLNAMRREGAA